MKRVFAILFMLAMLFTSIGALAEFDYSGMSLEELLQLRQEIDNAIFENNGAILLQAGDYIVGKDIAVGSYVVRFYKNKNNFSYGKILVFTSIDTLHSYKGDYDDYKMKIAIIDSNSRNGIEIQMSDKPEKFEYGKYLTTNIDERFSLGSSYRIILEEGQVLHLENNSNDMFCTIEQAKALFLN